MTNKIEKRQFDPAHMQPFLSRENRATRRPKAAPEVAAHLSIEQAEMLAQSIASRIRRAPELAPEMHRLTSTSESLLT